MGTVDELKNCTYLDNGYGTFYKKFKYEGERKFDSNFDCFNAEKN